MDRPATADGLAQSPQIGQARGVLRIRPFRQLYTALVLSSFGDWLGFLATTALAAQLVEGFTAKAYATGGVLVFRLLPAVLLGPLAGAFADRFDRRRTMVICDVARFALFLSIPLSHSLVYLLAASFLIESLSLFWIPAKEASVPNLVPRDQLESANQLSLVATYGTAPIAAAVFAGLGLASRALGSGFEFFSTRPVDLALYVDAATFLFSALTIMRLDIPSPQHGEGRSKDNPDAPNILASLREGVVFMRGEPLARGLLVGMLGALAAGGAIIAQGKLFAAILGGGDAAYGLLFGCIFLGIAGGVALGPKLIGDLSRRRAFGPSIVGAGAALTFMSVVPNLFLAAVATLLVGSFAGLAYVIGLTLLGGEVDDELRGRTFGLVQSLMRIDLLLVTGTTPFISGSIGSHVIDVFGVPVHINGVAVTLFVGGLLAMTVGVVSFRQMDDRRGIPLRRDFVAMFRSRDNGPEHRGYFLALEGGEGAGKSTQGRLLEQWFTGQGYEVVLTREPGATAIGASIRRVLLDPANDTLAPRSEALLYAADRAQHVTTVILPALRRGAVVITDRYVDSSLAYQGAGRELETEDVRRLSRWATEGLVPDLTVLLDLDPSVGLGRVPGAPDRIEQESLEFHQRVRAGFLSLASQTPQRYAVISATDPAEEVQAAIRARLSSRLPARTSDDAPTLIA
ncbi:MAG: dTMP kinase [Mycobacteriales bacterium]